MTPRLNPYKVAPKMFQALLELSNFVNACGLEPELKELVKIRASQINGCALCLHMHTRDARKAGETEERLYLVDAWRESPLYSDRERAALAWSEALTLIAATRAPDDVFAEVKRHFTDEEIVELTMLINVINSWNRLNVAFRVPHPVSAPVAA